MRTGYTTHSNRARDLADLPPEEEAETVPLRPGAHQEASIDELTELVMATKDLPSSRYRTTVAVSDLLGCLIDLQGEGWAERWTTFEATLPQQNWPGAALPHVSLSRQQNMTGAALALTTLDVIRPSYRWMRGSSLVLGRIGLWRDPNDTAVVETLLRTYETSEGFVRRVLRLLSQLQGHTGKRVRDITAQDIFDFTDQVPKALAGNSGASTLWRVLHELGWLQHESTTLPSRYRRRGQLSCEDLVDYYKVDQTHRQVLLEYLKHRTAALDYPSRRSVALSLLKIFWVDVVNHHPELAEQPTFALTHEQIAGWKERVRLTESGDVRGDPYPIMFAVRGFYLDIAQWALQDSYWAPWVAPCPLTRHELKGYAKLRRKVVAKGHERTRELAPLLPKVVEQAEVDRREAASAHERATDAGDGASVKFQDHEWKIFKSERNTPLRLRRVDSTTGEPLEINLTQLENDTFWSWAIIETLRQTGVRHEELLELTHLAIQPYKVPSTGETIPLIHIVPSKTDEERLIVASPELVHVLAQVVARVREGGAVPLTQRFDPHEKTIGPLLPHLFVTRRGRDIRVMSPGTVATLVRQVARKVDRTSDGQPTHLTPQDLRKIFATDALSSGLPPHIVQVLMGHKSIATTQGYAAVYPQDVIRHHRTFIAQRRKIRPTEEYRAPTVQEWEEFEAHFVTRKVSLGSCGRAYGTSCHHEHACVRCALLRPDPAQLDRLLEITANLKDRITEAKDQGWLGEVEGLQISLTGAQYKLAQMQQQIAAPDEPVLLGLPAPRSGVSVKD